MKMVKHYGICVALCVASHFGLEVATGSGSESQGVRIGSQEGSSVRVYGCPSEDSCRIDFRGSSNGRPVWVLRAVRP